MCTKKGCWVSPRSDEPLPLQSNPDHHDDDDNDDGNGDDDEEGEDDDAYYDALDAMILKKMTLSEDRFAVESPQKIPTWVLYETPLGRDWEKNAQNSHSMFRSIWESLRIFQDILNIFVILIYFKSHIERQN